jgi:DsbC/DsbD-like thiol-disulfide interchange protein
MRLTVRPIYLASLLLTAFSLPSDAQVLRPAHAQVALRADTSTIVPGQAFTVAVAFKLDPTWHVYYKDPGESGMPPEIKWILPPGLTAGELQFPKPEVLKTPAGTNFVYHDEVWLLVTMTPGSDFKAGSAIEILADAKWLECDAERCLPGKQKASLSVAVADRVTPTDQQQFESWRAKVKEAESFDPAAMK